MKEILRVLGKTQSGTLVVGGVFNFFSTTGLPLDVLFDCLKQKNMIPDWLVFYVEASSSGMKHNRIISVLETTISDSYGAEFSKIVIDRLELIVKECEKNKEY